MGCLQRHHLLVLRLWQAGQTLCGNESGSLMVISHMKRLLIIWHSITGGTEQMVRAVAAGAAEEVGLETWLLPARLARPEDLLAADALVFAMPETLASMTGPMKDFFDRCYYPLLGALEGRGYANLVCAGSDGTGAAGQLKRIVTGWRLREVAPALIIRTGAQAPSAILAPKVISKVDLLRCRELGTTLAAGLVMGVF